MIQQKILSVDFGFARIGLAISNAHNKFAIAYKLLHFKNISLIETQLAEIIVKEQIGLILIGYPYDGEGNKTPMCHSIDIFSESLARYLKRNNTVIPFVFWNETLTSYEAEENLLQKKVNYTSKDGKIDVESARIILQEYLNNSVL